MDQVAELFGTLAFGWVIANHGNLTALPVLTVVALLALPFEIWAIARVSERSLYGTVESPSVSPLGPVHACVLFV